MGSQSHCALHNFLMAFSLPHSWKEGDRTTTSQYSCNREVKLSPNALEKESKYEDSKVVQILARVFKKQLCICVKTRTVQTPGVCLGPFGLADDLGKNGNKTGHTENVPGFSLVWV